MRGAILFLFSITMIPPGIARQDERTRAAAESLLKLLPTCKAIRARLDADETMRVRSIPLDMQNRCKIAGVPLERALSAEELALWERGDAGKLCFKNKTWPRWICDLVAYKTVRVGMTSAQVEAAWGKPSQIDRSEYESAVEEVWTYANRARDAKVAFQDGFVKSVHTRH
jgi:hypothetical protein